MTKKAFTDNTIMSLVYLTKYNDYLLTHLCHVCQVSINVLFPLKKRTLIWQFIVLLNYFSGYKPFIISRDEELVDIMNASGSWIRVQGRQSFCFDTGNNAAACISIELLQKLGLKVNLEDTVPVHLAGADAEFPEVKVELKIRQHHFEGLASVGAVPKGFNLLVGMEIIKKLRKLGYTLG